VSDKYILNDDGEPVPCEDILIWGEWFERTQHDRSRVVRQDYAEAEGSVGVSTVFLGLDHNYSASGPPVLWESLVFGTSLDGAMQRYTSRADALRGHAELLARVRAAYEQERPT
jgi:hypothetical protein